LEVNDNFWIGLGGPYDSTEMIINDQPRGWWRNLARLIQGERIIFIWDQQVEGEQADLAKLAELANIQMLSRNHQQFRDLTFVRELSTLNHLSVRESGVSVLAPIARLRNLRSLSLDRTRVRDISPIAGLKNLRGLSLEDVDDITPLVGL